MNEMIRPLRRCCRWMPTTACITSSSWAAEPAGSSSLPRWRQARTQGQGEDIAVEKSRTHIWKPLLHEIAAGSMDVGRYELPYQAQGYWHGFQFRYGEMTGIDRKALVFLAATTRGGGARSRRCAPSIRHPRHRHRLRRQRLEHARREGARHHARDAGGGRALQSAADERLRARVCPGGPGAPYSSTWRSSAPARPGTELAAELHQTARGLVAYGLDKINPEQDIKITLIEAADRIVPALPERHLEGRCRGSQRPQCAYQNRLARGGR